MEFGKEFNERKCEICGDHIGFGTDHSECSEIKKEMYKDKKRPVRNKKLSKKTVESAGLYYSKHY